MDQKKTSIFANMNWLDWLLVLAFTGLLGWIAALFLPVYGWPLGALAALAMLYLAKSRRDRTMHEQAQGKEDE
jgi:hypothetical protein